MELLDKLRAYKSRRDFSVSSEPSGGDEQQSKSVLGFVVQKHWAKRLHYDFRLELDGTMKSWAVPKGPSLDSHDKRMAVEVEDHPLAYSSFEGNIPTGQYGAGKVIVWDTGTWHPLGDAAKGLRDGHLKFELRGHKLQGLWALIRMKTQGEKRQPWLLIKEKDALAMPAAKLSIVDERRDSVKGLKAPKSSSPQGPSHTTIGIQCALPQKLAPQLATLVNAPPADPKDWMFEIKFDGYRLLTRVEGNSIALFTRNGNDWTAKLGALHTAITKLKLPDGWYDGEIIVNNDRGVPDFGALQHAFDGEKTRDIVYYLFDMPYCDGYDLRNVPLQTRRAQLKHLLANAKPKGAVRYSDAFDADPHSVLASACKMGLEGVIGKRLGSVYSTSRSSDWIKLKCSLRQEFVIGGWTAPNGSRSGLGSLLLGVHDVMGHLVYVGNVGTGFSNQDLKELKTKLGKISAKVSPFDHASAVAGIPNWVLPTLVAEVTFAQWTRANHIRHASFQGLRADKEPSTIVRETAVSAPRPARPSANSALPAKPRAETVSHSLPGKLRVTHPERVMDPSSGITKIELVRYYSLVGTLILPHCQGRPVSLLRAPGGIGGPQFFQKHAEVENLPGMLQLDPALFAPHPPLLQVANPGGLLSAVQWNVVEFHTMNAKSASFERPDRLIFDLDPGEGVGWDMLQNAADAVHIFLTQLGLAAFLKTSGGKGLHVVVPIKPGYGWDQTKAFSKAIVEHLAQTLPALFVAKSGPKNRVGRIFIDYLRNGLGATTVSAWSARARPGLGVSVPVEWKELPALVSASQWTIRNVHDRLEFGNAPWNDYLKSAKPLTQAMRLLKFKA